ncbi:MAG: efflux RND transporter periplasmic adaptor subunit [Saprospiraceae bacterium]
MSNRTLSRLISLAVLPLLLAACGQEGGDKAAQLAALKEQKSQLETQIATLEKELAAENPTEKRLKKVGISELTTSAFKHYIDLQGRVDPEGNVPVTAKMPGILTKVLVKNGDRVKAGQLLAQIDDQLMQKGIAELNVQLATAQDVYDRQKGLWDQKIGSEIQVIQAKTQLDALTKTLETMKEQVNQTKIYAPISGNVDMVMLKAGQAISPGFPLCNVVNMSKLKISVEVPEAYAAKVKNGDQVMLFFPDLDSEVQSRVTYVSSSINPASRTFTAECSLPAGSQYRANMIAVVKIIDYKKQDAIVIPVNYIQTAETGEFVLIAQKTGDNKATVKKVDIEQGRTYNGMVEVQSGLEAGDWIISTGFQDVNNGEEVAF